MAMQESDEIPSLLEGSDNWSCAGGEAVSPRLARMCALERHRKVARQLEIPWETYKALNGIRE